MILKKLMKMLYKYFVFQAFATIYKLFKKNHNKIHYVAWSVYNHAHNIAKRKQPSAICHSRRLTFVTTRMHSSRMRTSRSLPSGGGGVSVRVEVSVQGVFVQGGSLSRGVGVSFQGDLYPGESLGGLCPGGSP